MVAFWVYDVTFLVLFTLAVVLFLYKKRENLQRQGIMYLYRTRLGIRLMDWTVGKFGKLLKPMQYLVITSGYILMISMLWLLIRTTYVYITSPILSQLIRAPPIAPLIPYFPKLFNLESFFPPLYFTYFLVALVIVAVSHEFAHGIFARLNNIKVKTTGFAFLGPILGAFVEPDEKQMQKAKKFPQLSILAAGTFANVIMTVVFGLILWAFFAVSFAPAGVQFNTYSSQTIELGSITNVAGSEIQDISEIPSVAGDGLTEIMAGGQKYFVSGLNLRVSAENGIDEIIAFDDSPAVNARLRGAITEINEVKITSIGELKSEISSYEPGENVRIVTIQDGERVDYEIELDERNGEAFLGIGIVPPERSGATGWFADQVEKVKSPFIYYEPVWDGDFAWFIYHGLWWIVVINILVALFNMLPVSILDGGRFFYLTVWGITGSERFGKKAFAFVTWFIIALLAIMMVKWFTIFI